MPPMKTHTDCMTSRNIVKLPGFIDVHVHVREPGAIHKEDFCTATAAALAGGITLICAMPNTTPSVVDEESLQYVQELANVGARCDYALFAGASSTNFNSVCDLAPKTVALKMYLNQTFTTLRLNDMTIWQKHLSNWPKKSPICVHAENETLAAILLLASLSDRSVHVCHIARKQEVQIIKAAKERGIKVTCEVCPHHLFLSTADLDKIGAGRGEVRPMLGSPEDQAELWNNMDIIDVFATDHAPHTVEEKSGANPPPGFPGLETILPLLLNAVHEGRLTMEDLINKFHRNPRKIFNLPEQPNTYIEVDTDDEWVIPEEMSFTKSKWTPFAGMRVRGAVHRVVLRGEVAYVEGQILVPPGFGQNVKDWPASKKPAHVPFVDKQEISRPNSAQDGHIILPEVKHFDISRTSEQDLENELFPRPYHEANQKLGVHFASENGLRSLSPIPFIPGSRQRCDSSSNYQVTKDTRTKHPGAEIIGKNILSVDMFSKENLNDIFNVAQIMRNAVTKGRTFDYLLKGKVMASIFYEVSTRTSCSFAAAMQRLGGTVIHTDATSSSAKKGETLEDSVTVMASYADVVVLRHPEPGAVAVSTYYKEAMDYNTAVVSKRAAGNFQWSHSDIRDLNLL